MKRYSIANLPEKHLTDPRGRPVLDRQSKPLTESMVTYLLAISTDPQFIAGLSYLESARYARDFTVRIRSYAADPAQRIVVTEDDYRRLRKVLDGPRLQINSTTLHCYVEFNDAIVDAVMQDEPAADEVVAAAAE